MKEHHPLYDLLRDNSLNCVHRIDTMSLNLATVDLEDVIKRELYSTILKNYFADGGGKDALTKQPSPEMERIIEYKMQLYVFSPDEMFTILMEAFNRGMELQYTQMYRVLGEQIEKAEEQRINEAKQQTSKE